MVSIIKMAEQPDDDKPIELPIVKGSEFKKSRQLERKSTSLPTNAGPRDPRFDPRCSGSGDIRHFVRNYAFIDELKEKELGELQKALRKEKDPQRANMIQKAISRHKNKISDHRAKLDQSNCQQPKRANKKVELAERYKELKQSGKLPRYLERKRKKILKKDEKCLGLG